MAAPMDSTNYVPNPDLIDDLESSFLNCLSLLTSQEYFNVQDSDETKTSIENGMQKFLELSRETEAFFLRKKMLVSFQKPEQLMMDEVGDLKAELTRKEQLLEKHTERLKRCQLMLQTGTGVGQPVPQTHPPQTQQPITHPIQHQVSAPGQLVSGSSPAPGTSPIAGYQSHNIPQPQQQQMVPGQGAGMGPPYQSYPGQIHTPPMQGPPPGMQHPMGMGSRPQAPPSYPQGPLAFLEQTTSSIGMSERR